MTETTKATPLSPFCDECKVRYIALNIDLGDFVVGRSTARPSVCIPCAKELLSHSLNGYVRSVSSRAEEHIISTLQRARAMWTVSDPEGNIARVMPFHPQERHRPYFILAAEGKVE